MGGAPVTKAPMISEATLNDGDGANEESIESERMA